MMIRYVNNAEYHICYLANDNWAIVDCCFDSTTGEMNAAKPVLQASTLQSAIAWCEAQNLDQAVVIFGANWLQSGLPQPEIKQ